MIRLELTHEEAEVLRDVLAEATSDLGMEIAGTDLLDFRDRLKRKRDVLRSVLERLDAVAVPGT
jgi:uncharacterized protein YlxP (DUF503 family)